MAQSLSKIILHIVFSTKRRERSIPETVQSHLHAYLAGVCKKQNSHAFRVGGTSDHIHISCLLPRTIAVSKFIQELKQSSSAWIKDKHPICQRFEWQSGYGAFSVGQSQLDGLINYIDKQAVHHKERSFQDEFLRPQAQDSVPGYYISPFQG